eukprot:CAMPEP_0205910430 /NCGR_PEP_ID=MMETSP1325-20131115/4418_1 /ASSEMBLY_ACC=CAM_ASM_000708 /TAXON_ID=236786 /ORGANISM="Florenciella sp., Strain RCC1007" /LENGTH=121 /DNA_ID=CAMNT_0053276779 /DNA_START=255 /DNA_END=620 /DNA_ORIENTATION=+
MKFAAVITALIALVAPAAAFAPTGARARGLTTIKMAGYVPDGLTPAQYKALKAKEAAAAKANKKKAMKGSAETLTTWQARAEKQNPNQPGAGHVYVKLKGKATYGEDKEGYANRFGKFGRR